MDGISFLTGEDLKTTIDSLTIRNTVKFERRSFVKPLIDYCLDEDFSSTIGIIYGLRSTGKTVGILQAAEELTHKGYKPAYARLNYEQTGMRDANTEILALVKKGITHFFIDEAPYLSGFLIGSAEWADLFVPLHKIKIIITGTDSFELWLSMNRALFHRFRQFSTNLNSFPEYRRVWGRGYDEYKAKGGVFFTDEASSINASVVENFIEAAVVENLIHTLEHCNEHSGLSNYYFDWLYAIDKQVIFKGIISILESTVLAPIRKNFIQNEKKNIPNFEEAIARWPEPEKRDIKDRIAESLSVYQSFKKIEDPKGAIDALISFLIKIGCLIESTTGISDIGSRQKALYFAHPALMNYALQETVLGLSSITDINRREFIGALGQAAEGSLNENIVYEHLLMGAKNGDAVFRYRDSDMREIDAVVINRNENYLYLIEVKSKLRIDLKRAVSGEARHLFDDEVLKNIGADEGFDIYRVLVCFGETEAAHFKEGSLILANIEELLVNYENLSVFFVNALKCKS